MMSTMSIYELNQKAYMGGLNLKEWCIVIPLVVVSLVAFVLLFALVVCIDTLAVPHVILTLSIGGKAKLYGNTKAIIKITDFLGP